MKRIATIAAAAAFACTAGLAQAGSQVSSDDFSVLSGPSAPQNSRGTGDRDTYRPQASPAVQIQSTPNADRGVVGAPQRPRQMQ